MSLIQILVMVAAGIGMLIGLAKQKGGAEWGRPMAIVCIVIALVAALWNIINTARGKSGDGIVEKELRYQEIGGEKLAGYLAEKFPGSKVLLLAEPTLGTGQPKVNPMVKGFKDAAGGKLTIVAEIRPEIPADKAKAFQAESPMESGMEGSDMAEMMPPLEYWYNAKIFDELLGKQSDFDILVTTIGLPQDARNSKLLKDKAQRPKIAILNGSIYDLKGAFTPDMLVAAITYNPKAEYDDKAVPRNLDEAFNKRFLLVTPENIAQIASQAPDLFRSGR
ncbi:MAG: hypothetical protein JXR77_08400 [Lentisphaeria bacterium]|nr:hypothetical protein [Lentisphaeria bacterium]